MFVFSNFLLATASVLQLVLTLYMWIVIGRAVISWVNPDPYNSFVQFVYKTTEPLMAPIRRLFPVAWGIGIDLSPLAAFLILKFLEFFLIRTLFDLAARFNG